MAGTGRSRGRSTASWLSHNRSRCRSSWRLAQTTCGSGRWNLVYFGQYSLNVLGVIECGRSREHTAGLGADTAEAPGRLAGALPVPNRLGATFSFFVPFVDSLMGSFSGSEASTSDAKPVSSPESTSAGACSAGTICGVSTSAMLSRNGIASCGMVMALVNLSKMWQRGYYERGRLAELLSM
jgi:hypothetical protein